MMFAGLILPINTMCWSQQAVISQDTVEIYDLPMFDQNPAAVLSKGDTVRVIGQRGSWVKIAFHENTRGWMPINIRKPAVTETALPNTPSGDSASDITERKPDKGIQLASAASPDRLEFEPEPDSMSAEVLPPTPEFGQTEPGRFGYSFGVGLLESDFAYQWRFVYHTTPKFTMEGSFKHVLGEAADSYLLATNFSYYFGRQAKTLPYLTAGMGVITTVPERSIDLDSVSHMMLNYGLGIRQYMHKSISLTLGFSQNTVFVETQTRHFREVSFGFLVGRFWH